ncbi:MAG TPA: universal stress protein [Streptosporangiaceae bacterium]|nr:universal stress protein [Streptosporangiaceae bacterium]
MSGVRRIIVGVSGSPGSLQALRHAADLARIHTALLIPVLAWVPPGGEVADRSAPSAYLRKLWHDAAWQRLATAIELAFGGVPGDVVVRSDVVRGEAGHVLVRAACDPGDLLVIGAGRRGPLAHAMSCRVSRYCVAHAQCPVVAVPPPALAQMSHGLRGWAFRHRGLSPHDLGLPAAR